MTDIPFDASTTRDRPATGEDRVLRVLFWVAVGLAAILAAGLVQQILAEGGGTNSYATLADAFLHGRLYVTDCFDIDCAVFDGRTYIVFPPGPALLAMPFVALFGVSFAGFIALSAALSAGSIALWWRILTVLGVERRNAMWLLLALAVGTPLYFVTIRGDGVWFMAQAAAFLFTSAALWLVVERRSLLLAGAFVGMAFLSRQMTILTVPFLYALHLRGDQKLISFRRENVIAAIRLAAPVVVAVAIYMAYNYARFGSPLDTGYDYIATSLADRTVITDRSTEIGLFSQQYFLFNIFYLFFQGFHVDFIGAHMTDLGAMDPFGSSLLAASPFVLMAVFVPWRRPVVIGALCALAMIVPMLIYHSNGFSQFNVQRYVLDWMPMLMFALALTMRRSLLPAFAVLVTYAIGLNLVTAVVAFTGQA